MEETLGSRIRALRQRYRIPVAELAQRAGITRQHLYLIEKDMQQDPGVQTILQIANILHVSTDYLLKGTPKPRGLPKDILSEMSPTGVALAGTTL
jgi:transcriptional regulator with XRE-family HTH domain